MTIVGRLPNLNVLKLEGSWFKGDVWETNDGEFEELMSLKVYGGSSLRQWISCSEHFPRLEHLVLSYCWELLEIPNDLGCIATLQTIQVRNSRKEASLSAVMIEEEQNENGNEELHVIITSDEWTKEALALECRKRNEAKTMENGNEHLLVENSSCGWNLIKFLVYLECNGEHFMHILLRRSG